MENVPEEIKERQNFAERDDAHKFLAECLAAPGYVIFAAKITPQPDGQLSLDEKYFKLNMNLDDVKAVFAMIKDQVKADLLSGTEGL